MNRASLSHRESGQKGHNVASNVLVPTSKKPRKPTTPKKYAGAKTSGLTAEIVEGDNDLTFELAD